MSEDPSTPAPKVQVEQPAQQPQQPKTPMPAAPPPEDATKDWKKGKTREEK